MTGREGWPAKCIDKVSPGKTGRFRTVHLVLALIVKRPRGEKKPDKKIEGARILRFLRPLSIAPQSF